MNALSSLVVPSDPPDPPGGKRRPSIGPAGPRNFLQLLADKLPDGRARSAVQSAERSLRTVPGANPIAALAGLAGMDEPLSMIEGPAAAAIGPLRRGARAAEEVVGMRDLPLLEEAPRTARLQNMRQLSPGARDFAFETSDGPMRISTTERGGVVTVDWVGRPDGGRMAPGAAAMRAALREVAQQYPEAKSLRFERITGARTGPAAVDPDADPWITVQIPRRLREK